MPFPREALEQGLRLIQEKLAFMGAASVMPMAEVAELTAHAAAEEEEAKKKNLLPNGGSNSARLRPPKVVTTR